MAQPAGTVMAPQAAEPQFDAQGHTDRKIVHRMSPDIYLRNPFVAQSPVLAARAPAAGSTTAASSPISHHGGPVMTSVSKVVVIWYGNWNQTNGTDNATGQQIILDAIYGMSVDNNPYGYNYSGITTGYGSTLGKYTQTGGASVSQASSPTIVQFTQPTSNTYGGTTLSDKSVFALVKAKAGTGDPNAIYLVLSSSEIRESSGFLTRYCGWHSYGSIGSTTVKYGFIGNPARNLSACAAQTVSPNGNAGVDAMISVIAHELVETVTDPQLNAWYNASGSENSDMCAWTFGQMQQTASGAYWNVQLPTAGGSSRYYLLQRQLGSSNSKCYINATGPVQ